MNLMLSYVATQPLWEWAQEDREREAHGDDGLRCPMETLALWEPGHSEAEE